MILAGRRRIGVIGFSSGKIGVQGLPKEFARQQRDFPDERRLPDASKSAHDMRQLSLPNAIDGQSVGGAEDRITSASRPPLKMPGSGGRRSRACGLRCTRDP